MRCLVVQERISRVSKVAALHASGSVSLEPSAENDACSLAIVFGDKQVVVKTAKDGPSTTLTAPNAGEPLTAEGGWKLTGDTKLQAEGKADQVEGKVQNTVGGVKDSLRDDR